MANVKYALGLCVGMTLCAASVDAQTPSPATEKVFLNVNVGGELATRTLGASVQQTIYFETATLTSNQPIGRGVVYDVDGGYRVRGNLFGGILVSVFQVKSDATTSATIPDPIFFNRPKTVTGSTSDLKRTEVAIIPHVTWALPLLDNMDVTFSVGAAFMKLSQDFVGGFTVTPPQNLTIVSKKEDASAVGPYAQVDLIFNLASRLGVGGYVRYAGAHVDLSVEKNANVGGMQAGGGVRLRF